MGEPTILLACGASKLDRVSAALELYTGPLFRDARDWALSLVPRDRIFILSARHGFLPADHLVEPYEQRLTLSDPHLQGASCPRCLAALLRSQFTLYRVGDRYQDPRICRLAEPDGPLYFVGGELYRNALQLARVACISLSICLPAGRTSRGIGAQRAWLRANHGRLPL
jgi:hypothetical protein